MGGWLLTFGNNMKTIQSLALCLFVAICSSTFSHAKEKVYDNVQLGIQNPKLDITIWHDGSVWVCDYTEVEHNYFLPKTIYTAPAKTVDFSSFVNLERVTNEGSPKNVWITLKENGLGFNTARASNSLRVWSKMLKDLPLPEKKEKKDLLKRIENIIKTEQGAAGNPLPAE